jgi:hypothetical protein
MNGQLIAVVAIIAMAAGYLAWRLLRRRRRACGCEHCPVEQSAQR